MARKTKKIILLISTSIVILTVIVLLPLGNKLLLKARLYSINSLNTYMYHYNLPKNLHIIYTPNLASTQAVPILLYHGIISDNFINQVGISTNTKRTNFIAQMEMLKENGYQTITVTDYDLWRQGKFTLPSKPIIITFDDGRKDSYFTVDKVLKKLGFQATIFIVTARINAYDPFFLSWDELKQMHTSGHWEIEAHGRNSHDKFIDDAQGDIGNYLTARMYTIGKGMESIADYQKRVEDDYINGIQDIKNNLGIDPLYFAVPLNSYGNLGDGTNYPDAKNYNVAQTQKYFKLAFIQAYVKDNQAFESFYNYKDTNPFELKRLEVESMTADQLLNALNHFAPGPASFTFPSANSVDYVNQNSYVPYGTSINKVAGITLTSNVVSPASRILFGDWSWQNYSMDMDINREIGHSISVIVYDTDENNYVSLDWYNDSIGLTQFVKGQKSELASYKLSTDTKNKAEILIRVYNGVIDASVNGITVASGVHTILTRGSAGFGVWDPNGAQATITKMSIVQLTSAPAPLPPVPHTIEQATTEVPTIQTLPYSSNGFTNSQWQAVHGDYSIVNGNLNITGNPPSSDGTTIGNLLLGGSQLWKNYTLKAKLYPAKNQTITLTSRYQDANNYVICSYNNFGSEVEISRVVNGYPTIIAKTQGLPTLTSDLWNLAMKVNDSNIECMIDDQLVLSANDTTIPPAGGIGVGFQTKVAPNTRAILPVEGINVTSL